MGPFPPTGAAGAHGSPWDPLGPLWSPEALTQRWESASGLEGHAALVQASERDYTEVTPYFLRIPTLEDVARVRKRARNMSRTRAAAQASPPAPGAAAGQSRAPGPVQAS